MVFKMITANWLAWLQNTIPIFGEHAHNILPGQLWVGDIASAMDRRWLQENGITHVVSVTSFDPQEVFVFPTHITYCVVFAHDNTNTELISHWPKTSAFINHAITHGGRVLVHCKFGRSRSIATAGAYMIAYLNYTASEALAVLKKRRPQASPNSFFVFQLYLWAMRQRRQFK